MGSFSESVLISAPQEQVWAALSEIGAIADWNPGVRESHLIGDQAEGLGAARYCDLGGKNYLHESVVEYQEGEALTMRVDETNLPFKSVDIRFTLRSVAAETEVTVSPAYTLKYGPMGTILDRLAVRKQYARGMVSLLQGLKKHVEQAPAS
ncbi:MAG: SRPBCC family protein [Actinomycetia bacterium]|nr:SRPBCC family protein [Actinomycetes bacterium]